MPRITRDRLTVLVYANLAVYGYFLYGFGPAVPLLREEQGVSRALSGLHGTALAVGAVLAGLVGAAATARWGRGALLRTGMAGIALGVVVFTAVTPLPLTLLGALVAGTFGALMVNAHAPILTDHHQLAGPAAISEANALAAAAGLLAPLTIGLLVDAGAGWRAGVLVTVAVAAAAVLAGLRVSVPDRSAAPAGPESAATVEPPVAARLPRHYWPAWAVLVLCISVEFSLTIWSSELLRERVGLSEGAAAGSVSALVAGMCVGRAAGARLALRRPPDWLLLRSLAVTAAGFALFWLSTAPLPALAGLFTVGLGVALQFPVGIARVIAASDGRPDLATARASLGAGLAIGLGPFVLGWLADAVGTHRAFLLVPGLLGAAAATVVLSPRTARPVVTTAG